MDSVLRTLATLSIDFSNHYEVDHAISITLHESLNWRAAVTQTLPHLQDDEYGSVLPVNIQQPAITPAIALKSLLLHISNKKVNVDNTLLAQNMMRLVHALCREIPKAIGYVMGSTDPTSAAIKEMFFTVALRFGQSSLVAMFLASGTNPNALIKHTIPFKMRLRRGKAVLERSSRLHRVTPLQLAAAACDIEMARTLLEYGAKPNLGNPTPLQIICSLPPNSDSVPFARHLLQLRASVNTNQNDVLLPPLLESVAARNATMVQCLLGEGATDRVVKIPPIKPYHKRNPGPHLLEPYSDAVYPSSIPSNFPSMRTYTHIDRNTDEENITALQIATIIGDKTILEMLGSALYSSQDRANVYRWALITACLAADEYMVCQTLNAVTDMKENRVWLNFALCAAAWISDCRIARRLLKFGATPDWQAEFTMSAVQAAAQYKNGILIELLHSCGYDINAPYMEIECRMRGCDSTKLPEHCQPLECAIRTEHIQTVRLLLQLGAPVSGYWIAVAIACGIDDMIFDLLARGVNLSKILDGEVLLEIALERRKGFALIRKLVDSGAEVSTLAVITAIRNSDEDVSKYLLDSGADILGTTRRRDGTVLDAAAQSGSLEIMRKYFDCGGHYSSYALLLAAEKAILISDYSMVQYLSQRRPTGPLDVYENTLFVKSILKDDRNLIELFLNHNIGSAESHYCWHSWDKEIQGRPRLHLSSALHFIQTRLDEVRRCFRSACPSTITPLWAAAHTQQKPLVEHFISRNHPPDALLLESALYNPEFSNFEIRQQLIETFPLSSIRDKRSCRRLLMAAIHWNAGSDRIQQHINSLRSLDFVFGEDTYPRWTPLQLAAECGNIEYARLLLDAQANVNEPAAGRSGRTALQMAVYQENFELTVFLLERGADINALGSIVKGYTALQLAVSRRDLKMAILLLDHGADVNGPPSAHLGMTAIEISAELGLIDMTALLLPYVCLHGHMRLHFVRAVVIAERKCHYATAKLLKQGRWTEEDRETSITPQATERYHACPQNICVEQPGTKWCGVCDRSPDIWPDSSSEEGEENTTHSAVALTQFEGQAANAGALFMADDLALPEDQFEILDTNQLAEFTDLSFDRPDTTTRWLDDLVVEYFESFHGNWQET